MGTRHLPGDTLLLPTGRRLLERLALELVTLSALWPLLPKRQAAACRNSLVKRLGARIDRALIECSSSAGKIA